MNKLLLVLLILLSTDVFAVEEKIIDVRDGREHLYSPKDWMIVPRKPKRKKKVVAKAPAPAKQECPVAVKEEVRVVEKETMIYQKNHLRLLGGFGRTGTSLEIVPELATLSSTFGPVFGVAYGRNLSERWSLEGELLTNSTGLLGVGYNF